MNSLSNQCFPQQIRIIGILQLKEACWRRGGLERVIEASFVHWIQIQIVMFSRSRKTNQQALYLKNLDLLAYEHPSVFPPDSLPSLQTAEEQLRSQLVRSLNGKQHLLFCDLEGFKQYGPGLYLLFKLIKFIGLLMTALFPLMIVNIILITNSGEPVNETNFETRLESTTISELDNPTISRIINAFVILSIALGLGYWRWRMPIMIQECRKEVSLPSYCTVVMKPIPNFFSQKWLKEFAETHYGPVHSIYTAKNYHQDLHHYKELRQAVQVLKEERQFYLKNKSTQSIQLLCEHFLHLRKLYHSLTDTINDQKIYEPYCVFLTFQNPSSKKKLLQSNTSPLSCLPFFPRPTLQGDGLEKPCFKSCKMEPDGVAWQNLNLSRTEKFLRCGLVFLVLFLFLFVAVTIIFLLVSVEIGLFVDQYDDLTLQQILMTNSTQALKSYCMQLSYSNFKATPECKDFSSNYTVYFFMFFMLPVVVTFLKMIFISIMKRLVAVRRHKDSFQKMQWQIVIISLFYFIKAALIPLLIYRSFNIFGFEFDPLHIYLPLLQALDVTIHIKAELIHSYHSFSPEWVAHASHNVIIIAIISFNFTIIYHFVVDLVKGLYHKRQAKAMRTQQRMNKMFLGEQFQIQMIYSELGALLLFVGTYFSCMPIVYPLVLFSIGILYWGSKYTFIRLCKRPLIYAHGITSITVNILFISLVLHCLLCPQYFSDRLEETAEHYWAQNIIDQWQNFALLITIAITYFLGNPIISMILSLYSHMSSQKQPEQSNSKIPAEVFLKPSRIQSYSMHQNQQYQNILQTLFIINKIEINRIGYFNHHTLNQLKEEINKPPKDFLLFQQLLTSLTQQCQTLREENKLKGSKQESSLALLMQISRNAEEEVRALQQQHEMQSMVKSKIVSVLTQNHNLSNISSKKSKQGSYFRRSRQVEIEPDPQTQIRIN